MRRKKEQEYRKIYIGIDNGVSGTIGWTNGLSIFGQIKTPIKSEQNYTKTKGNISRIDHIALLHFFQQYGFFSKNPLFAVIERPMVNPGRFKASLSAIRALESTQIILEYIGIPYQFIDSKEWQKEMLPRGIKGADKLKISSQQVGTRLFPTLNCKPDADGILMAEWARRIKL